MDDTEAVSKVIELLSGKWTVKVFFQLGKQPKTFTEINKKVDKISNKMLSKTLNELTDQEVVTEAESVNGYLLTKKGYELRKNLEGLAEWSKAHSNSGKVMIVEDDSDQAELYSKWLTDFETEIVEPESMLDMSGSKPLAVIMDRYLENQESDRFLKYISETSVPVLICTGVEPTIEEIEMPFHDYLVKPLDRGKLEDSLKTIADTEKDELDSIACKNKKDLIESRKLGSNTEREEKLKEIEEKLQNS